jgi:hypothetical protein
MDTRHADIGLGYTAAAVHYDNTGDEVAVVRAGEDEYGIWVAGSVVPEATPQKVAKLRRSPISGDWRRVDGNLELTAALAVNVPAFPVYAMDGEDQLALVAAGTLEPAEVPEEVPTGISGGPDLGALIRTTVEQVFSSIQNQGEQEERAVRLADLLEDEEIYLQRDRMARFSALTAAAQPPEPAPSPVAAPQAPQGQVPVPSPEAGESGPQQPWPPDDETLMQLQMQARFSIIDEPGEVSEESTTTDAARQNVATSPGTITPTQAPPPNPAQG